MRYNAPTGAQNVAGDCQLVGRRANIAGGIVKDKVLEMDQLAVDPQRGAGIGELGSFDPPLPDRRAGDALVETRESDPCCGF